MNNDEIKATALVNLFRAAEVAEEYNAERGPDEEPISVETALAAVNAVVRDSNIAEALDCLVAAWYDRR